jgi:hypothetical protein
LGCSVGPSEASADGSGVPPSCRVRKPEAGPAAAGPARRSPRESNVAPSRIPGSRPIRESCRGAPAVLLTAQTGEHREAKRLNNTARLRLRSSYTVDVTIFENAVQSGPTAVMVLNLQFRCTVLRKTFSAEEAKLLPAPSGATLVPKAELPIRFLPSVPARPCPWASASAVV